MFAPNIDQVEALSLVAKEFVESIKTRRRPLTDGSAGSNVVRILEAAETSLRSGGSQVRLDTGTFQKGHVRMTIASRVS